MVPANIVPSITTPSITTPAANGGGGNVVIKPGKYCTLEQLLENNLIREVRTPGEIAAAVAG
jgi:hypothetical protein